MEPTLWTTLSNILSAWLFAMIVALVAIALVEGRGALYVYVHRRRKPVQERRKKHETHHL